MTAQPKGGVTEGPQEFGPIEEMMEKMRSAKDLGQLQGHFESGKGLLETLKAGFFRTAYSTRIKLPFLHDYDLDEQCQYYYLCPEMYLSGSSWHNYAVVKSGDQTLVNDAGYTGSRWHPFRNMDYDTFHLHDDDVNNRELELQKKIFGRFKSIVELSIKFYNTRKMVAYKLGERNSDEVAAKTELARKRTMQQRASTAVGEVLRW